MKRKEVKTLTTHTEVRFCPSCFQRLDAVTSMLDEHKPEPGDFSVCINCASVLRLTDTMDFEMSSLEAIPTHSRMQFARAVQAVNLMRSMRGPTRIC